MKHLILIATIAMFFGCVSAKISGTGINVHDPMHGFEVQANSINAEVNSYVQ